MVTGSQTRIDAYARVRALLDANDARYRLIDHPAEGRTEIVSSMRGHPLRQAAKCIIVMVIEFCQEFLTKRLMRK